MNVFDIPIEGEPFERVSERIVSNPSGSFWIVTANAEILLEAKRDKAYADVLRQADERLVDGSGPWLMLKLAGQKTVRLPGVELANNLINLAVEQKWRVALIGGYEGAAEKAGIRLKQTFPDLQLTVERGGKVERDGKDDSVGEEARHRLTLFAPQVLLVAFGHPKQERWIARYLADFPSVKVVVGIGGTIDFWAGTAKRAPKFLQTIGLEWLWRLMLEPRRIKRIWNAVIIFPIAFIVDHFLKRKTPR